MVYDYVVRSTDQKDVYEVHKFDGGDAPVVTYTVTRDHNGKWKCNCPSGRFHGYCRKHIKFAQEYRKTGRNIFEGESR